MIEEVKIELEEKIIEESEKYKGCTYKRERD